MSKIKRFVVLLAVAITLLAQTASAATPNLTISQVRDETTAGWHETYEAHGRTIIVDIDIQLPDVDALPVLRIRKKPAVDASFAAGYDAEYWQNDPGKLIAELNRPAGIIDERSLKNVGSNDVNIPLHTLDWDTAYAEDNPLTYQGAVNIIAEHLLRLGIDPDQVDFDAPTLLSVSRLRTGIEGVYDGEAVTDMGYYNIALRQKLHNIPLYSYASRLFQTHLRKASIGWRFEFRISVESMTSFEVGAWMGEEIDAPFDDIPLCSFEKVKVAYEKLIQEGLIRTVDSLQLAYVVYADARDQEVYWAVPTWVMECEFYETAKKERPAEFDEALSTGYGLAFSPLAVNAQTGKVIDPYNEKTNRTDCPDIVSW